MAIKSFLILPPPWVKMKIKASVNSVLSRDCSRESTGKLKCAIKKGRTHVRPFLRLIIIDANALLRYAYATLHPVHGGHQTNYLLQAAAGLALFGAAHLYYPQQTAWHSHRDSVAGLKLPNVYYPLELSAAETQLSCAFPAR